MCVSAIFFCSISATISIVETCDLFFSFIKFLAGINRWVVGSIPPGALDFFSELSLVVLNIYL